MLASILRLDALQFPAPEIHRAHRIYRRDPRCWLPASVSTNHRAAKSHADFERPTLAHAATPVGPLTATHRICLDSRIMFTLCSHRQGVYQTPNVQSHRRGMMRLRSVNWGEGGRVS